MLWSAARLCLAGLAREPGLEADRIVAVSLAAQMSSHLLVDAEGKPLTSFLSWADRRAEKQSLELMEEFSSHQLKDMFGASLRPGPSWPFPRLKWWRENEPALLDQCRFLVQPKDWVLWKLCREWVSDLSSLRGLAHQETGLVAQELLAWAGLSRNPCLPSSEPDAIAGRITDAVARQLNLPAHLPVITGWNDLAAGVLGSTGLPGEPLGFDITGTSEHLGICLPRSQESPDIPSLAEIPLNRHHQLRYGVTSSSGQVLDWYWGKFRGKTIRETGYRDLADEVGSVSPGVGGLLFLPSLNGERAPWFNPQARGVLFGLTPHHTQADMSRAVLEGITFLLRSIQRQLGTAPREIRVCGGCSEMTLWNQLKADIFGLPITTLAVSEAGCLGAAILAARALDLHSSLDAAANAMIRPAKTYEPNPKWTGFFAERHLQFEKLYKAVEPCFIEAVRAS